LLPSGPGGVRKSTFHGPWQKKNYREFNQLSRQSRAADAGGCKWTLVPAWERGWKPHSSRFVDQDGCLRGWRHASVHASDGGILPPVSCKAGRQILNHPADK